MIELHTFLTVYLVVWMVIAFICISFMVASEGRITDDLGLIFALSFLWPLWVALSPIWIVILLGLFIGKIFYLCNRRKVKYD